MIVLTRTKPAILIALGVILGAMTISSNLKLDVLGDLIMAKNSTIPLNLRLNLEESDCAQFPTNCGFPITIYRLPGETYDQWAARAKQAVKDFEAGWGAPSQPPK